MTFFSPFTRKQIYHCLLRFADVALVIFQKLHSLTSASSLRLFVCFFFLLINKKFYFSKDISKTFLALNFMLWKFNPGDKFGELFSSHYFKKNNRKGQKGGDRLLSQMLACPEPQDGHLLSMPCRIITSHNLSSNQSLSSLVFYASIENLFFSPYS